MKRGSLLLLMMTIASSMAYGQGKNWRDDFDKFKKENITEFQDFRRQAFEKYRDFVRQAWTEFKGEPPRQIPKEEEVLPVLSRDVDIATESWFSDLLKEIAKPFKRGSKKTGKVKAVKGEGEEIAHQQTISPEETHIQPEPEHKVEESHELQNNYRGFRVFGTEYKVRIGDNCRPVLKGLMPNEVADAMEVFSSSQFDNLLFDCLQERKKHHLSDWAYYQMIQAITNEFYGVGSNEGTLVMAFLFSQSGYKVRLAQDDDHLYMLVATHHKIYNRAYINCDNEDYYLLDGRSIKTIFLCPAHFEKEGSLSLQMSAEQDFSPNPTPQRTITSKKNHDFSFTITSNKNYLDFYNEYPRSYIGDNYMTQWVMYAETPLEKGVRNQLYPKMREKLRGLSQAEQVQQLLWWIQTGLQYAFDDDVWGGDRPFFGEESLFYPYCDCEDRSILFSHFVRDLLGLDVALVHYPGHLAAAVAFTDDVKGNYYLHDGRKFVICDPTIIPGQIGQIMEHYSDAKATLMLLRRQ